MGGEGEEKAEKGRRGGKSVNLGPEKTLPHAPLPHKPGHALQSPY